MDIKQNLNCDIQFIAKIQEKPPLKSLKTKKSTSSLNRSKSRSNSRSKSKDKKVFTQALEIPKASGCSIKIGKKLSKGTEQFTFDRVYDKKQSAQEIYKTSIQPLIHSFVMENKNVSLIHFGSKKSKKNLWFNDVKSVDSGLYGLLVDEIFNKITVKNMQYGNGQLITVKLSFFEITNFQENIIDLLNEDSPYQNQEYMIASKEILDLDDFLEAIQYIEDNDLFSITQNQGKTQICKIKLSGSNTNCEINFINIEDTFNKDIEEYYYGFFKDIKDQFISQKILISKNNNYYNSSRLIQTLQQSFNQNYAITVLSSFIQDPKDHLLNLQSLKFARKVQNLFKHNDIQPIQSKYNSNLTTNYNSNNLDQNQSNQMIPNEHNNYLSGSYQSFNENGAQNNFFSNQNSNSLRDISNNLQNNRQSQPSHHQLSNFTTNYQSLNQQSDDKQSNQFGKQQYSHNRSRSSIQFVEGEKYPQRDNNFFSNSQSRNKEYEFINKEIDQLNESIQHPPTSSNTFLTQWMKNKTEFIENILTNISLNQNIERDNKNLLLNKILHLKQSLQQLNQVSSPKSLPDKLQSGLNQKQNFSGFEQRIEELNDYYSPRIGLDGNKKLIDPQRVSLAMTHQKRMSVPQLKSVIKSPVSKSVSIHSQMDGKPTYQDLDRFSNYYYRTQQPLPLKQVQNYMKSEEIMNSRQNQNQVGEQRKQSKTINFKADKKEVGKKNQNISKTKKNSILKRSSLGNIKELSNSYGNISMISKKSGQSRKSVLSRNSIASQKSQKSTTSKKSTTSRKSITSKKSTTSKKSNVSKSSKQNKPKIKSGFSKVLKGKRLTELSLMKKIIPNSRKNSSPFNKKLRSSFLKNINSPASNRSRSSMGSRRNTKDSILQDIDFRQFRSDSSPSLSARSRKTSLSKSPKFGIGKSQVPATRGRTLSNEFYQNKSKDPNKKRKSSGLFQSQSPAFSGDSQTKARQGLKEYLQTFRELIESSSSESDYMLYDKINKIQPNMPLRKSYKFQSKVKEYDLSFENEKNFFIQQQGKSIPTDLLKQYHKLLLKSNDIQKLLEEQVNINDELQKEVFTQEEKFNILQRKHLKKKKEKNIIKKEMNERFMEFEKMGQRDTEIRQQLHKQTSQMQKTQIQNEQQEKFIKNLENQIQEIKISYESRISELEEVKDNQKIQIEKLNDILKRNQNIETDLRSQLNFKSQQFDTDIKNKRDEFERLLSLNKLAIKQTQASKTVELQSYDKKLKAANEEIERLQDQVLQIQQKFESCQKIIRQNEETINNQRKEKSEFEDKLEDLQNQIQQLKSDKSILQQKNTSIMHQKISQRVDSEKNIKEIQKYLLFYKAKQNQPQQKLSRTPSTYYQAIEQDSRNQKKQETPVHNQHYSTQSQTTFPTHMYQNTNQSQIPLQISNLPSKNNSSPIQQTNNNNHQYISVSEYDVANSTRENKSERNNSNSKFFSHFNVPQAQRSLLTKSSSQNINLNDIFNTLCSTKVSNKGKDESKTQRIQREQSADLEQLIQTQRDNKKKQLSSSLNKQKQPQSARGSSNAKTKKK